MSPYSNIVIYYFSGTGNAANVASWFAGIANESGINSHIVNIAGIDRRAVEPPPENTLVIFVSPIHGFNYPPVMLHFIARFPKGKNKVILMNTRAGMLIGKYVTPGLTGIAFYLSALLLKLKGYKISGMLPVDLPSNWLSLHPGLNDRTVRFLHQRNKIKVDAFAHKILSGKSSFKPVREILQDLVIAPVGLLYYFVGRFILAKTFYASADCNSCDICIKNCPVKAIIKVDDRPYWTFKCESCMKCMSYCPKKAIETGHGFVLAVVLLSSGMIALFYSSFEKIFFKIENEGIQFVVEVSVFITIIAILYRFVHYAMRFRFFERLMVYTSLTRLKFWGRRYRALKHF